MFAMDDCASNGVDVQIAVHSVSETRPIFFCDPVVTSLYYRGKPTDKRESNTTGGMTKYLGGREAKNSRIFLAALEEASSWLERRQKVYQQLNFHLLFWAGKKRGSPCKIFALLAVQAGVEPNLKKIIQCQSIKGRQFALFTLKAFHHPMKLADSWLTNGSKKNWP